MFVKFNSEEKIFEITTIDANVQNKMYRKADKAIETLKKMLKKMLQYANLV